MTDQPTITPEQAALLAELHELQRSPVIVRWSGKGLCDYGELCRDDPSA